MAVPRIRPTTTTRHSDEVEVYHRTYTTLLRSSGETWLRVLEPAHRAMRSSLHALADSDDLDLGAFIYASRRLPADAFRAERIVLGQEAVQFARAGIGPLAEWTPLEAPARRRRWYADGEGTLAVLLASASDLDDLVPTLVAYQLEWNKLHRGLIAHPDLPPEPAACSTVLGGAESDWERLFDALGATLDDIRARALDLRVRMLGGSAVGYARMTRRWWSPVQATLAELGADDRPLYVVSSNAHSLANLLTGVPRTHEAEVVEWVEREAPPDLRAELARFREQRARGSWENFLYYCGREALEPRGAEERAAGVTHLSSTAAMRVSAQVMPLDRLRPELFDPRLGDVDADALAAARGVIVNIEYPLGLAAYNILREITTASDTLRGVYVLGKAATLNAAVGDVMISSVIHDEHSGSTYWLDNAFSVEDIAPYLVFGSGLDNQRAVTVRSTFLQNREYLDLYYRDAFTVVEMEAGPFCNAVYEIADVDRHPTGEAVNFAKLPIDLGIIHYASDTPYTQARTLGARGLSYYGMDSTYASSVAIARRILSLEGALKG
ncbi:MAG TPA: hypothetical protein VGW10_14000 [Solirubrobacteraceae bacterium]|nr:hypothetical protein [Solirubrobacteraceae bacterium]